MAIRVVRLGSPRVRDEGLRLGTVRRPPRGVPKAEYSSRDFYDVWLPELAPSERLVRQALRRHDRGVLARLRASVPCRDEEAGGRAAARAAGGTLARVGALGRLLLRGRVALPSVRAPGACCGSTARASPRAGDAHDSDGAGGRRPSDPRDLRSVLRDDGRLVRARAALGGRDREPHPRRHGILPVAGSRRRRRRRGVRLRGPPQAIARPTAGPST